MKFSLDVKGYTEELTYDSRSGETQTSDYMRETTMKYKYAFGKVEFREIELYNVGSILIGNYELEREGLSLQNTVKEGVIEMHLNYGNSIEIGEHERTPLVMKPMSYNLLGMKNVSGYVSFGNHTLFKTFDIHLQPELLDRFKGNKQFDTFLKKYNEEKGVALYPKALPITEEMHKVVNQIIDCSYTGYFRASYLRIKTEELLLMLLAPCFRAGEVSKTFFKISDEQIEKIKDARKYIEKNLTRSVSVKELSKEIGLSQLKLKESFKILFGKTVFEYSLRYRMDYATRLLMKGQSVNEVYPQVGYATHASFSHAFKNCIGISPTQVTLMNCKPKYEIDPKLTPEGENYE